MSQKDALQLLNEMVAAPSGQHYYSVIRAWLRLLSSAFAITITELGAKARAKAIKDFRTCLRCF
jgi:hypothetical protein